MKLLDGLFKQNYSFGKDNVLIGEFKEIHDKCLDRGWDNK